MQATHYKYTSERSPLLRYERFINFWLRFFDAGRERQFLKVFRNYTMLTKPKRLTHLVVQSQFLSTMVGTQLFNAMVGPQLLHIIVGPQLLTIMVGTQLLLSAIEADNPTLSLHRPKSTPNWHFFKIFKFWGPSLPGMTSFTFQHHFPSGVYYDNCDCHIICARP